MNFLEKLRSKPAHVRGRYALVSALVVTGVVAGVWQISLSARLAEFGQPTMPDDQNTSESEGSLGSIIENARTYGASIFGGMFEGDSQEVETVPTDNSAVDSSNSGPVPITELLSPEKDAGEGDTQTPKEKTILIGTSSEESSE